MPTTPRYWHHFTYWTKVRSPGGARLVDKYVGSFAETIDEAAEERVRLADKYGGTLVAATTHSHGPSTRCASVGCSAR